MRRSYKGALFTLAGWLLLCGAKPPAEEAKGRTGAGQANHPAQMAPSPAPGPTASPSTKLTSYGYYDSDSCDKADDYDAGSLCAQWRAAIATEKAAHEARRANLFGMIAASLSVVTVAGLIFSIWQTRGALGEARLSNRIAARAARKAGKLGEQQIRAYIVVVEPKWVVPPGAAETMIIETRHKNVGQTPALDIFHEQQIMISFGDPPTAMATDIWDKLPPVEKQANGSVSILAKGDERPMRTESYKTPDQLVEQLWTGQAAILVRGWVEYADIFGLRHRTEYCFHSNAESLGTGQDFIISPFENNMS